MKKTFICIVIISYFRLTFIFDNFVWWNQPRCYKLTNIFVYVTFSQIIEQKTKMLLLDNIIILQPKVPEWHDRFMDDHRY